MFTARKTTQRGDVRCLALRHRTCERGRSDL